MTTGPTGLNESGAKKLAGPSKFSVNNTVPPGSAASHAAWSVNVNTIFACAVTDAMATALNVISPAARDRFIFIDTLMGIYVLLRIACRCTIMASLSTDFRYSHPSNFSSSVLVRHESRKSALRLLFPSSRLAFGWRSRESDFGHLIRPNVTYPLSATGGLVSITSEFSMRGRCTRLI